MNLGELFTTLAEGELRGLGITLDGAEIDPDRRRSLVNYTNKALTRLYTRFKHEVDFVDVLLSGDMQRYLIDPRHALSDMDPDNDRSRYILDSEQDPFTGGLIRILGVRDRDSDEENLLINDRGTDTDSVKMLSYNKLFFKAPVDDRVLTIEYQKNHPKIDAEADEDTPILLFPMLEEALTMHIAGRFYTGIGGEENLARGTLYFREYERICMMAQSEDMLQDSGSNPTSKLQDRGFI
jgi:hypothetical protein